MTKSDQFKYVVLSYLFYERFIRMNDGQQIPKELRTVFNNVVGIVGKYSKKFNFNSILFDINEAIRAHEKTQIDYVVASITAIVSYYESVEQKNRMFSLASWHNINLIENEIFDENLDLTIQSQKFCDYIIGRIIKGAK